MNKIEDYHPMHGVIIGMMISIVIWTIIAVGLFLERF